MSTVHSFQNHAAMTTVGVLALQGAFYEHVQLLQKAAAKLAELDAATPEQSWRFIEVRTQEELNSCDGLIIPGGESTAIALVAARSNLLDPLRDFVKIHRKPTWGTCAGLILLAESANRTKHGGQDLIGGLDVRVNRNHFGRQTESFQELLDLPFLKNACNGNAQPLQIDPAPFPGVFIRAPVVEKILPVGEKIHAEELQRDQTIVAPSRSPETQAARDLVGSAVEVMGVLPGRVAKLIAGADVQTEGEAGDIVAVRQGNVFGTSFHPELTSDPRIHMWWLSQVKNASQNLRN
ncbi:hypothetical protein FQN57_004998 [Myotisia sp. PD_48]|nr:hypothetical protein FQN57_004998 [Myotisia sp. PD_48]